jgi:hypothetical protein
MHLPVSRRPSRLLWCSLALAAFVAGCGGGDDDTATPAAMLSGVAAVGDPVVGGAIAVKCAGGAALTTTTSATGGWQVSISGQTLPCAVQVSGGTVGGTANTTPYHSIAVSFGNINVTPLTDLVVAQLLATAPQTWFGAPVFSAVNAAAVSTALSSVVNGLGIATTVGTVNPLTTGFTAQVGNPVDNLLEALKTALANLSQTYADLLGAAQSGTYVAFTGFGAAFSTAYQALPTAPPAASGSLTVEVSISGAPATAVTITGVPRPANQAEFCDGLTNDPTFTGLDDSGGSLTINSCSFSGNVGQVSATLNVTTPIALALPYSIRYTYN